MNASPFANAHPQLPPGVVARFLRYAPLGLASQCWIWNGPRVGDYGTLFHWVDSINHKKVAYRANRLSLMLSGVEIPDGLHALHSCDTPLCVNPAHLRPGTPAENNLDAWQRGRAVPPPGPRNRGGEQCSKSKLTDSDVREIRALWTNRVMRGADIARKFGITASTVSGIVRGRTWKHLLGNSP